MKLIYLPNQGVFPHDQKVKTKFKYLENDAFFIIFKGLLVQNDLKSNQNPSDIANEIISLAKNIKISGTEVSISSLIPRGDRLSEKGKKINKELEEKHK